MLEVLTDMTKIRSILAFCQSFFVNLLSIFFFPIFCFNTSNAPAGSVLDEIRARLAEEGGTIRETSPFYQAQMAMAANNPEIARAKEREEQMQPLDLENDVRH
jgi:hypothetical protein